MKPQKTRWDVYRDVQASLLDKNCTPGTFHLKNRGITLVAREVRKVEEDEYELDIGPGQGIIDGGHTYRLIIEMQQSSDVALPKKQFVKVEVMTRVPDEWVPEIAAGLNTPILAYTNSLLAIQDALAWIKAELVTEPYFSAIAWSESERGTYDVRDLLALLTCFNTASYANTSSVHPVVAYENPSVVLASFEQDYKQSDGSAYKKLRPLLKDILVLHDTIRIELPKLLWRMASERLAALTAEKCREIGDNPDALGRSASHWSALHKEVAFLDLMAKPAAQRDPQATASAP